MMELHSEAEIFQNIVSNMTRCEPDDLVNSYDIGRKTLRIKIKIYC